MSGGSWSTNRSQLGVETELNGNSLSPAYGAKLAFSYGRFFLGVDYGKRMVRWTYNKMPSTPTDDNWEGRTEADETAIAPYLGFRSATDKFQLWVGMFASDDVKFKKDMDPTEAAPEYHGTGMLVGVGWRLGNWVRLGVEYQNKKYAKMTQDGQKIDLPGWSSAATTRYGEVQRHEVLGYLAVPFAFFTK